MEDYWENGVHFYQPWGILLSEGGGIIILDEDHPLVLGGALSSTRDALVAEVWVVDHADVLEHALGDDDLTGAHRPPAMPLLAAAELAAARSAQLAVQLYLAARHVGCNLPLDAARLVRAFAGF